MVNFNDALDTNVDDIEKPPVQPQGTYGWRVSKIPTLTESNSGEWNIIEFPITAIHAEEDVDEDEVVFIRDDHAIIRLRRRSNATVVA